MGSVWNIPFQGHACKIIRMYEVHVAILSKYVYIIFYFLSVCCRYFKWNFDSTGSILSTNIKFSYTKNMPCPIPVYIPPGLNILAG